MWRKPCRTFHPWCPCIKTRCLYVSFFPTRTFSILEPCCSFELFTNIKSPHWYTVHSKKSVFNTLRPRQNGFHFPDDIFKWIFLNENVRISIKISLKFVPSGPINNIPALVQIMAWRRPGDKPLSEPMMVSLPTHICVARLQLIALSCLSMYKTNNTNHVYWCMQVTLFSVNSVAQTVFIKASISIFWGTLYITSMRAMRIHIVMFLL